MDSKAIIIVKSGSNWWDEIALNYSQLSLDFVVSSRLKVDRNISYFVVDEFNKEQFVDYDIMVVIQAGVILKWGYFERRFSNIVDKKNYSSIGLTHGVVAYTHNGEGHIDIADTHMFTRHINCSSQEAFIDSHAQAVNDLIDDSNMSYLVHNELPNFSEKTVDIDWGITVSSGFFINSLLRHHGFKDSARITHIDVSRISLMARQYTIENWDGTNIQDWIDHLNEKYPSMQLFNKHKFGQKDNNGDTTYLQVWDALQEEFNGTWQHHWREYQNLQHDYRRINISDDNEVNALIKSMPDGQGIIWWNGALKRMPGNFMKDADASHRSAIKFVSALATNFPNLICYGSDHCLQEYDGIPAQEAYNQILTENSRKRLWQKV